MALCTGKYEARNLQLITTFFAQTYSHDSFILFKDPPGSPVPQAPAVPPQPKYMANLGSHLEAAAEAFLEAWRCLQPAFFCGSSLILCMMGHRGVGCSKWVRKLGQGLSLGLRLRLGFSLIAPVSSIGGYDWACSPIQKPHRRKHVPNSTAAKSGLQMPILVLMKLDRGRKS